MLLAGILSCSTQEPRIKTGTAEGDFRKVSWDLKQLFVPDGAAEKVKRYEAYLQGRNPCLSLYRLDETHDRVIDFFIDLTGSEQVSLPILYYADRHDLSFSLVFSLAWVESRFQIRAVNRNAYSVDRGLFQLNSSSFPDLREEDFFEPEINIRQGVEYLRYCLDAGGSEIVALAMYNAGRSRVSNHGTPRMTLDYISRIIDYRKDLEKKFRSYILQG